MCAILSYANTYTVQMDSLCVTREQVAELEEAMCEINEDIWQNRKDKLLFCLLLNII
jgi:hypothetical protein